MPELIERPQQPYVGMRRTVTMRSIPEIADRLPEVFGWLAERGVAPAGAPFLKYNVIDMAGDLEMEAGVPVASPVDGDDRVFAGVLPAGRYARVTHVGHPDELEAATANLLAWARQEGLRWDAAPAGRGERWTCRLEIYHTDPRQQPDMTKWETDLVFRVAD